MTGSADRYPVDEALRMVEECLAKGSTVLGFDGLWVHEGEARPDLGYIADFSPDGLQDFDAIVEVLSTWPREDAFCVEIVFATPG